MKIGTNESGETTYQFDGYEANYLRSIDAGHYKKNQPYTYEQIEQEVLRSSNHSSLMRIKHKATNPERKDTTTYSDISQLVVNIVVSQGIPAEEKAKEKAAMLKRLGVTSLSLEGTDLEDLRRHNAEVAKGARINRIRENYPKTQVQQKGDQAEQKKKSDSPEL